MGQGQGTIFVELAMSGPEALSPKPGLFVCSGVLPNRLVS